MGASLLDEADRELDFDALCNVLDDVVGEEVCVDVEMGARAGGSRFAASGVLRRVDGPGVPTFAVGDLFVLVLNQADFAHARLRTFDGHSFYAITMAFGAAQLRLADVGSAGMDYQGY